MRSFSIVLILAVVVAIASGFHQSGHHATRRPSSVVSLNGLFDGFINSMEAGYKGEDSAFARQKAADEKKIQAKKNQSEARRSKGFNELKDVNERTFAKVKYEESEDKGAEEKKTGLFGLW
jgi:hypothetical protein